MNMNQFTQKSIEALKETQSIALQNGNQQLEQVHLLSALIASEDGLICNLLQKLGISVDYVRSLTDEAISSLPKVSGVQSDRLYASRDLDTALTEAEVQAKKMKDEFISVEHLMAYINQAIKLLRNRIISPRLLLDMELKMQSPKVLQTGRVMLVRLLLQELLSPTTSLTLRLMLLRQRM